MRKLILAVFAAMTLSLAAHEQGSGGAKKGKGHVGSLSQRDCQTGTWPGGVTSTRHCMGQRPCILSRSVPFGGAGKHGQRAAADLKRQSGVAGHEVHHMHAPRRTGVKGRRHSGPPFGRAGSPDDELGSLPVNLNIHRVSRIFERRGSASCVAVRELYSQAIGCRDNPLSCAASYGVSVPKVFPAITGSFSKS